MVLGLSRPFPLRRRQQQTEGVLAERVTEEGPKDGITTTARAVDMQDGLAKTHKYDDPNLPEDTLNDIENVVRIADVEREIVLEKLLEDQSPYPEVAAAVRNYDEDLPANTIRAWTLGMLFATIGSALNMLFSLRAPSIIISSIVAQLVAYPFGVLWAKCLPNRQFKTFGIKWNLNPGPFNMKEHTIIVVMANCTFGNGAAYSTDVLVAQEAFYGQRFGWGFQLLLTLTTQSIGYGLAGLARRFLVWPAAMIWPTNLVNTSLFYALHDHSPSDPALTSGWSISRYRYFTYVFIGSFCWYWFPGYIAQFLSAFVFVTWIKPNNVVVNQLFGGFTGLGLIPLTFDWTQITGYVLSPLIPPWHAIANTLIGMFIFYVITVCGIHYSGTWYAAYLPISDSNSYDNTGAKYNVTKILTPEFTLNEQAYKEYSPLFLSTTFAMSYGLSFATITSLVVHTFLYYGKDIWKRFKLARSQEADVHMKLMCKYPDAADWWYVTFFVVMLALSFVTCLVWDTGLTWWALIIALIVAFVFTIPIGMIQAITNVQIGLNVLTEFLIGYILPGRPIAMMLFKTYGYIAMYQGLAFVTDLKLGHYMKIPPRTMFFAQVTATIWSCIVQIAVFNWALGNINEICDPLQANHFTCPQGRVFFQASVIWGLIGPMRIFSPGQIYYKLLYFFIIGALAPVVFYFLTRAFPKSPARYLMAPVIFGGSGQIPPATCLNYLAWGSVGYIFNRVIRKRYMGWWSTYNYLTSAALDSGLAISTIVIFFALTMSNTNAPDWWGNTAIFNTADFLETAVQKVVNPGEIFGPSKW
jgi:OPT family small oligopeptide transporter